MGGPHDRKARDQIIEPLILRAECERQDLAAGNDKNREIQRGRDHGRFGEDREAVLEDVWMCVCRRQADGSMRAFATFTASMPDTMGDIKATE